MRLYAIYDGIVWVYRDAHGNFYHLTHSVVMSLAEQGKVTP